MTIGTGAAIFGLAGQELLPQERAFFRDYDPFGFILFGRNVASPEQLRRLTAELRDSVGREAPVFIDQESGRVQRLGPPHWRAWAPPFDTVAACASLEQAARVMQLRMRIIAHELRAAGIDANCAPLADVAVEETHPFLKNRCYGTDVAMVSRIAAAVGEGLLQGGVLPVVKHLPGHGRSRLDSHLALPRVEASREELEASDFAAFRALAHLPMGMTAHLLYTAYDAQRPATQSPVMVEVIRREIGFDGLLMSDDLMMKALGGDLFARTEAVIAAGVDVALHCSGEMAEMQTVARAAGDLSPEARRRAEAALAQRITPPEVDVPALAAELAALTTGGALA